MKEDNRTRKVSMFPISSNNEVDYFDFIRYFPHTPTALCIRECVRLCKLKNYPCKEPILDVGCGDGLFASLAFETKEVWGIDIDAREGRWAQASRAYSQIIIGDISASRLPDEFFHTCVANCSMEHVRDLSDSMAMIYKSMTRGGIFYLFVPESDWAQSLFSVEIAKRIGFEWLSDALRDAIDGVFRHHHLYTKEQWIQICVDAGFEVVEASGIGTEQCIRAFEAFLIPSIAGYLTKQLSGRWTLAPRIRSAFVFPTFLLVQAILKRARAETRMAEYFLHLRKPTE